MLTAINILNQRLSQVEKLFHLNQKPQEEAKEIVQRCSLTNDVFELTCKSQVDRYEKNIFLATHSGNFFLI